MSSFKVEINGKVIEAKRIVIILDDKEIRISSNLGELRLNKVGETDDRINIKPICGNEVGLS